MVAFGTSTPELAVNLAAAFADRTDLSFGNVVGSNIANIGLVLGLGALIAPIGVHSRVVRIELPVLILVSIAVAVWAVIGEGFDTAPAFANGRIVIGGTDGTLLCIIGK